MGTKTPVILGQWVCSICKNKISPPTLLGSSISGSTITTEETVASQECWLNESTVIPEMQLK
ncbi:unnamed protein product [Leptidea sinapis]|uniref:Uncharacterized protein n=1 Tax=Leptidea sinapis TaxID=189913 RepID=A0A5E4Q4N2_9NEOP|nr:unnamed protein product [Leptidea sinapis]